MDYRNLGGTYYVRMDRGDEIMGGLLEVCRKEGIGSAVFSGIAGCSEAEIQTFVPEIGDFESETVTGMLELISYNGNIVSDESGLHLHAHGLLTYVKDGEHCLAGGHMGALTVLYTAEIELRPVTGGVIRRKRDPETGTGFWAFDNAAEEKQRADHPIL